jgi:hypothetical protein
VVEVVDPEQASEAGRLARESTEEFEAGHLEQAQELAGESALAAAYTYLQRIVGVIAFLLPIVLWAGNGFEVETSISAYYHTRMGNVFVGALWALAVFFLSYNYKPVRGFNLDNKLSNVASVAAVGVAVFPTTGVSPSQSEQVVGRVHLGCAFVLFALLAVFALFLFPKTGDEPVTQEKRRRNVLYRSCGVAIVVAMALVPVSNLAGWEIFVWLEAVCVWAFAISWLVKGGFLGILADKKPMPAGAG